MITEQELKEQCTPDIIKRMVELAEGFDDNYFDFLYSFGITPNDLKMSFPLLIHRAVEGWNKLRKTIIYIKASILKFYNKNNECIDYRFENYQPQSLTHTECAMLHCLIDIFREDKIND